MKESSELSLLYHDVRSQLQAIMSFFQVVQSVDSERDKRFRPYLLCLNTLYAVLPQKEYNAEVDILAYLKHLLNNYENTDCFRIVTKFNSISDSTKFYHPKKAVYLGMLIYELLILLKSECEQQNISNLLLNINIQVNHHHHIEIELINSNYDSINIEKSLIHYFEGLTFLSILIKQLKLKLQFKNNILKINQL